jgi:hypothetical protein
LAILALVVLRNQPAASPEEDEDPEVATAAVSVGPADGGGR